MRTFSRILIYLFPCVAEITIVRVIGGCFCQFFRNEKCFSLLTKRLINKIVFLNLLLDISSCKKSIFIICEGHGSNVDVINGAGRI